MVMHVGNRGRSRAGRACWSAGQIGESAHPRSTGVRKGSAYKDGAQHREYMPDLLVVITDDIGWIIEGKAADE
jgi:hypothetical protein